MTGSIEIKCINKSDRYDPHERITHVGGINPNGQSWKLTQAQAIEGIERGKWMFHVTQGARMVGIIVATSHFGHKYLKTEADGDQPNNLLSLPECPR